MELVLLDQTNQSEQILDLPGEAMYIRMPTATELPDSMRGISVAPLMEALAEIGDKWGRADLAAMADVLPEDWQRAISQVRLQGLDPASFAALVANAASAEELPAREIDGESMVGLAATVTAEDFAAAQQSDASTTTQPTSPPALEPEPGSIGDIMSDLLDQLGELDPELADADLGSTIALDLFDYDDGSIEVEAPDAADTEDVTAELRIQFES